jgi:hypothetical protein
MKSQRKRPKLRKEKPVMENLSSQKSISNLLSPLSKYSRVWYQHLNLRAAGSIPGL